MNAAIAALPDHRERVAPNYLYAFEFKDGRIKIGVTWNPRARCRTLAAQFRAEIVHAVAVEYRGKSRHLAEADVLRRACRMASLVSGYAELFTGLQFGAAKTLLCQIANREFIAQPTPFSWTKEGRRAAVIGKQQRVEAKTAAVFARLMDALINAAAVPAWPHPDGRDRIDVAAPALEARDAD